MAIVVSQFTDTATRYILGAILYGFELKAAAIRIRYNVCAAHGFSNHRLRIICLHLSEKNEREKKCKLLVIKFKMTS